MDSNNNTENIKEVENAYVIIYNNAIKKSNFYCSYLNDYSKLLKNAKLYDPQILNWQIENSFQLKDLGINMDFVGNKLKEQNKSYYRYENLINQMTYRLEKHGKLAPLNDISKPINDELLSHGSNNPEHIKINEVNYYNPNDSFIDDNNENSDENDGILEINLKPGNYTEEEILKKLNKINKKSTSIKIDKGKALKKKRSKSINKGKDSKEKDTSSKSKKLKILKRIRKSSSAINKKNNKTPNKTPKKNNINANNSIDKPIKRKFGALIQINSKEKLDKQDILIKYNELMREYIGLGNNIPVLDKEKELFIKKIIPSIKELDINNSNDEIYNEFSNICCTQLNIQKDDFKILLEFEIYKSKLDGNYCTCSKLINQFVMILTKLNINDFTDIKSCFGNNADIQDKLNGILLRVINYRKNFNEYYSKYIINENNINTAMEKFLPKFKERIDELLYRITIKFNEYFNKNNIKYSFESVILYIKNDLKVEDLETKYIDNDVNGKICQFGIEYFLSSQEIKKRITEKKDENNIDTKVTNKDKINDAKEEESDLKSEDNINMNELSKSNQVNESNLDKNESNIKDNKNNIVTPAKNITFNVCPTSESHSKKEFIIEKVVKNNSNKNN